LVVDDETALTGVYQKLLKTLRYECTATNSPAEALAWLEKNPAQFDLVITDLTMPEMNGLELAQQAHKLRADLPIILATGFKGTVNERQMRQAGICELVEKPVSLSALAGVFHKWLAKK
jgi:CheY-like chemotaxis protein